MEKAIRRGNQRPFVSSAAEAWNVRGRQRDSRTFGELTANHPPRPTSRPGRGVCSGTRRHRAGNNEAGSRADRRGVGSSSKRCAVPVLER